MYGILLYDGVEPIDVGAAFGVLSIAKRVIPTLAFTGVAARAGAVTCANGLRVIADHGFYDCPPLDLLVVTGGPGWTRVVQDEATLRFVRGPHRRLASLCTGAMILEAAGVLDGRAATTKVAVFEGETPPLDLLGPAVDRRHAVLVEDDGIVTSGGITLGIDAMFHLLARDHGAIAAAEVARVMEYDRALAANRAALGHGEGG
ncbi:DJ-1/PfpI family protein [Salinarimonas ramus]|uniref:AraC family transcriptional regulator n=1 Tax=Salinarimonas ramus TaxID=690164 RepID=A0A917V8G2_9HYPH|nr:DJ-1/PfpI family protein [Salinarimonas ramus]GGK50168.1 AraC family transcriptional regulator [Salinarimonas ramus]